VAQRERAKTMKEMALNSRFFFVERIDVDPKAAAKHFGGEALPLLAEVRAQLASLPQWSAGAIHTLLSELATRTQLGLGKIAQPLRVAVTGTAVSPPIDATLELLGRERALARIDAVLGKG
jgi:glutamyl-tRNA synthetase